MMKTIEEILKEQMSIALRQQDVINPDHGNVSLYEAAKQEAIETERFTSGFPENEWLVEVRRDDFQR